MSLLDVYRCLQQSKSASLRFDELRRYCRVKDKMMKGASQQAPKRVTKAGNIIYFTHFLLCLTLKKIFPICIQPKRKMSPVVIS